MHESLLNICIHKSQNIEIKITIETQYDAPSPERRL